MPNSYAEIKKFLGLFLQTNSFTTPDGALETADNVIITKDDRIIKRRGLYEWFNGGSDTLNAITTYQNFIIAVFTNKVKYFSETGTVPNKTGSGTTNSGQTVVIGSNRTSRFVESNNNLYFTTNNGPLKLTAYNSTVVDAGAYPGLDISGMFLAENGAINGDTQVAYRVVFGYRDGNSNLILGSPSDSVTLTNLKILAASWTRTANVVTVTLANHNLIVGMIITVTASTGATPVGGGTFVVTSITSTTFTFSETLANSSGSIDYTVSRTSRLSFSIPTEITSTSDGYFYQLYRTSQSISDSTTPQPDYKLVDEQILSSAEITAKVVFYNDDTDDILLGAELYTNPNSREGELQSNFRPPLCEDMGIFKNHVIYSNTTTRHLLNLSVIDSSSLVSGDYIEVKVDATTRRYVARTGVANSNVTSESVAGVGTVTITYTAHGLANGDTVYVSRVTGTVPVGTYTVSGVTANTFDITSGANTATIIDFEAVTNGTYNLFKLDLTSSSIGVRLRNTAQGIVKAINRDSSSLVYASYTSGITDVPGKFRLLAKDFTGAIYVRANSSTSGDGFNPILPSSFASGNQVYSKNERQANTFFSSKIGEPEAVPIVNSFPVGPRNKELLRTLILRDSIIHLTEGGVYKTVGDGPSNFTTTALDTTVICVAPNSAQILNNNVVFLSNQGVCLVTENSVEIISRRIEDVIQPILSSSVIATETYGVAYESERLYLLSTIIPNGSTASTVYTYNILNQTWTSRDTVFKGGWVGPNDTLYLVTNTNRIAKERKTNTKLDFSDQNHAVTVTSVASDKLSAVISIPTAVPEKGDVIVKNNIFTRINTATFITGTTYTVTFSRATNLVAADSVYLYDLIESRIELAPFHAGSMGKAKQFSQMQIHMREPGISRLLITYSGYNYGGSDETEWLAPSATGGWGLESWGFFPWGQGDAIDLTFGTSPAPVIRTYVSKFQQRNTFIQPVLLHKESGEPLDIQAMTFVVRSYVERVTK